MCRESIALAITSIQNPGTLIKTCPMGVRQHHQMWWNIQREYGTSFMEHIEVLLLHNQVKENDSEELREKNMRQSKQRSMQTLMSKTLKRVRTITDTGAGWHYSIPDLEN